jgi:hypothetical protein
MTLLSFERPTADGWRYGLTHRTRQQRNGWRVERWTGEEWQLARAGLPSYRAAREAATADRRLPVRD